MRDQEFQIPRWLKSIEIGDSFRFSFEETYLVSSSKKEDNETKEYLIAVDVETNLLSQINFETGSTVKSYFLSKWYAMYDVFQFL